VRTGLQPPVCYQDRDPGSLNRFEHDQQLSRTQLGKVGWPYDKLRYEYVQAMASDDKRGRLRNLVMIHIAWHIESISRLHTFSPSPTTTSSHCLSSAESAHLPRQHERGLCGAAGEVGRRCSNGSSSAAAGRNESERLR
jgi:hypothetical protein